MHNCGDCPPTRNSLTAAQFLLAKKNTRTRQQERPNFLHLLPRQSLDLPMRFGRPPPFLRDLSLAETRAKRFQGIILLSSVCKVFERFHGANNHRAREYSRSVAENFGKKEKKEVLHKSWRGVDWWYWWGFSPSRKFISRIAVDSPSFFVSFFYSAASNPPTAQYGLLFYDILSSWQRLKCQASSNMETSVVHNDGLIPTVCPDPFFFLLILFCFFLLNNSSLCDRFKCSP